ncbi:MAG: AMP-binding protein [Actinomycetota bacterium]|nr:AMP-binding protein [Actinomycetota bacterium]
MGRYLRHLKATSGLRFADYGELWRWSVTELDAFWSSICTFFDVHLHSPPEAVLPSRAMPGTRWFPGATLNYAEHLLRPPADPDATAVIAHSQTRDPRSLTHAELATHVARARAGLRRLGVGPGDRVVAYLPNIPEAVIAFIATASLGAIWASCAPEFGVRSVVDRLGQLEPTVLLAVSGYTFRDRPIDVRDRVADIRRALPTLSTVVECRKRGIDLAELDLSRLRAIGTAGSPLPADGYRWIYDQLGDELLLINGSGGTDVCGGLVSGNPWTPVYLGEISAPCLGVDAKAFDPEGREVVDQLGELVVTAPMPSMPVGLWGDDDGERLRDTYFSTYPGVWRHGDWVRFSPGGSCVVAGRSDATLNRGGVRLGTAEFYRVIEALPEIADSLVVHVEEDGGPGELVVFVVPSDAAGADARDELGRRVRDALRKELSPRHAPDRVEIVSGVPRTLTGKKLEMPIKRILQGHPAEEVVSRGSLRDPGALDDYLDLAARGG